MICDHVEKTSMEKKATFLHGPDHGEAFELDDGVSALGVRKEAAATPDEMPMVVALLLPEGIAKTMQDGRVGFET